jgi:Domain of unknown function (DUF4390)
VLCQCVVVIWMLLGSPAVFAQQDSVTQVKAVKLEPSVAPLPPGWTLTADFGIELGHKLRDAVDRGLPLQFAADFKLLHPRWYWADEETVSASYPLNLSYHALTRTYRLVTPVNTQTFPHFEDAIAAMSKITQWPVIRKESIVIGEKYNAQVRFRLVLTELPKPFQVTALVNTEWDLSSGWLSFDFTPRLEVLK